MVDVLIATPTIETVRAIHAALDSATPLALLHPNATPDEHARQREMLARADIAADTAFVLFTSGSTGPARGVELSRTAVLAAAAASAAHLGWRPGDRWLACL